MKFKHPPDAMRAKFNDQLSCRHCAHVITTKRQWCDKVERDPQPHWPLEENICPEFKYQPNALDGRRE